MPHALPTRRMLRHHLLLHRPPERRGRAGEGCPLRTSDLILAVLSVALLGGLALMAAYALATGT